MLTSDVGNFFRDANGTCHVGDKEEFMQTRQQHWDPLTYQQNARFVSDLGMPVVELLAPKRGERILDLGCGDGALTQKIAALGCHVVGVDNSEAFVSATKELGLDARVMDGHLLAFQDEFDAVFSNAALHWMQRPDAVIDGVSRALRRGGRFVAEFGGTGNVSHIVEALSAALEERGFNAVDYNPWYFPSISEYRSKLQAQGFAVEYIELIPRPTPLPGDVAGWLSTFAQSFAAALPTMEQAAYFLQVRDKLQSSICDKNGTWIADYVRLRVCARKTTNHSHQSQR